MSFSLLRKSPTVFSIFPGESPTNEALGIFCSPIYPILLVAFPSKISFWLVRMHITHFCNLEISGRPKCVCFLNTNTIAIGTAEGTVFIVELQLDDDHEAGSARAVVWKILQFGGEVEAINSEGETIFVAIAGGGLMSVSTATWEGQAIAKIKGTVEPENDAEKFPTPRVVGLSDGSVFAVIDGNLNLGRLQKSEAGGIAYRTIDGVDRGPVRFENFRSGMVLVSQSKNLFGLDSVYGNVLYRHTFHLEISSLNSTPDAITVGLTDGTIIVGNFTASQNGWIPKLTYPPGQENTLSCFFQNHLIFVSKKNTLISPSVAQKFPGLSVSPRRLTMSSGIDVPIPPFLWPIVSASRVGELAVLASGSEIGIFSSKVRILPVPGLIRKIGILTMEISARQFTPFWIVVLSLNQQGETEIDCLPHQPLSHLQNIRLPIPVGCRVQDFQASGNRVYALANIPGGSDHLIGINLEISSNGLASISEDVEIGSVKVSSWLGMSVRTEGECTRNFFLYTDGKILWANEKSVLFGESLALEPVDFQSTEAVSRAAGIGDNFDPLFRLHEQVDAQLKIHLCRLTCTGSIKKIAELKSPSEPAVAGLIRASISSGESNIPLIRSLVSSPSLRPMIPAILVETLESSVAVLGSVPHGADSCDKALSFVDRPSSSGAETRKFQGAQLRQLLGLVAVIREMPGGMEILVAAIRKTEPHLLFRHTPMLLGVRPSNLRQSAQVYHGLDILFDSCIASSRLDLAGWLLAILQWFVGPEEVRSERYAGKLLMAYLSENRWDPKGVCEVLDFFAVSGSGEKIIWKFLEDLINRKCWARLQNVLLLAEGRLNGSSYALEIQQRIRKALEQVPEGTVRQTALV